MTKSRKRVAITVLLALFGATPALAAAPAEIVATGLRFAEGTIFVGQTLFFVDYGQSSVYRLDGQQVKRVWHQGGCGANGLVQVTQGMLVACYDSGTVTRISLDGQTTGVFEQDSKNRPFDRPNDLVADTKGNVYFTASGSGATESGKVYFLPPGGVPQEVASGIHNANGVTIAPDGRTLYLGESSTDRILQFDVAASGALSNRRVFLDLDTLLLDSPGTRHTPDGLRVDKRGRLFVSLYRGGGFAVFDPSGSLLSRVELPGAHHANLALTPDESFVYGTVANDVSDADAGGALYRIRNPVAP